MSDLLVGIVCVVSVGSEAFDCGMMGRGSKGCWGGRRMLLPRVEEGGREGEYCMCC